MIEYILSSIKVHLASVYEKILSSVWVTPSRGLILKSIVYCMCVMFSSDVSWGSMNDDEDEINDNDIVLKDISEEEAKNKEIQKYTVVLLGDEKVGKTQIVSKKKEEFHEEYKATIGTDFDSFFYSCETTKKCYSKNIKLHTWNTSGSDQYKSLSVAFCKNVDAVVLVYDITDKKSFDNISTWLELAKSNNTEDPVYFLVGNKTDLGKERKVPREEAEKFAGEHNMTFFEVSAKDGTKIKELFAAIAKACVKKGPIEKIKNEYIEDTKNEDPTKNGNSILNVSQESEDNNGNNQTPPPSKNKRCDCCPCCNKDEDDKKKETDDYLDDFTLLK